METSKYFRPPEMHIAQQSRRERLRIQQQQLNHPHDPVAAQDNVNHQQLFIEENIIQDDQIVNLHRNDFGTWKSIGSDGLVSHPNNTSSYMNHHLNSYDARFSLSEIPSRLMNCPPSVNQTAVPYDSWANDSNVVSMVPDYAQQQFNSTSIENVNAQGLSLSLSTMPLSTQNQCQVNEKLAPDNSVLGEKTGGGGGGDPGPLGPFTGYETILKTSKYLNPTQQLLNEISKNICVKDSSSSHDIINAGDGALGCCSSNEKSHEAAGSSCTNDSSRPDHLQQKEKLLYMQEEVCRRYKHYHEQMQMVVSSFESVAGLTSATPYISVALKAIYKLFHSLRNAISDHLKCVKQALGEDISISSSPTTGASSSKCDTISSSMFKLIDNPYRKHHHPKPAVNNILGGLFEPQQQQQHVWRPQRGLPERAVAILRTWLFDHFLHPYPTDSDKHMLASQTGLTRNQVSNWFINARVRIWKPMVEEIHSLETKATTEADSNIGKYEKQTAPDDGSCSNNSQQQLPLLNTIPTTGLSESSKQVEFPGYNTSSSGYPGNPMSIAQAWNEKGSIVDFVPYLNGGMDLGGFGGAVSLTLGLRQNGQQPPQHLLQQQPAGNQIIRRHCGDQIVYDFVG